MSKLASPKAHSSMARAVVLLRNARANRIHGKRMLAQDQEVLAEKALASALSEAGILSNDLLTTLLQSWDRSRLPSPLDVPEWQALIFDPACQGWGPDYE